MMIVNGVQRPGEGLRPPAGRCSLLACPILEPLGAGGASFPPAMTIPYVGLSDSRSRRFCQCSSRPRRGRQGLALGRLAWLRLSSLRRPPTPSRRLCRVGFRKRLGRLGWREHRRGAGTPHPSSGWHLQWPVAPEHWSWGVGSSFSAASLEVVHGARTHPALAGLQQWARASGQGVFLGGGPEVAVPGLSSRPCLNLRPGLGDPGTSRCSDCWPLLPSFGVPCPGHWLVK